MLSYQAAKLPPKLSSLLQMHNKLYTRPLYPVSSYMYIHCATVTQKANLVCNNSSILRASYMNQNKLNRPSKISLSGFQYSGVLSCQCKNFNTSQRQHIREDNQTTAVAVWKNLAHLKSSPFPALTLGLSGLIPFISAPAYMIATGVFSDDIAFAQVAYGACILSFLGGVRWGFTLPEECSEQPDWHNLGYSVVPSLIAWTGLLLPSPLSSLTLMGGLGVVAYFDTTMHGYPLWFKALRFTLSFIAVLSLWTSFVCGFLLKSENKNQTQTQSE